MNFIDKIKSFSLYVTQQLSRHEEWAEEVFWQDAHQDGQLIHLGQDYIMQAVDLADLNKRLRVFRNQQMTRIAIRDLGNLSDLAETMRDTSDLADVLVQSSMSWHAQNMSKRYGQPIGDVSGEVQQMLVLGMGKLGGQELNFSSDIDMIYVYPERGVTQGGRQQIENEQFFIRLAQAMNKSLSDMTMDGIVYRVDMRLRPFGSTGPLVVTFSSLENYYALHGRAWERYALVKARLMAGDVQKGAELMDILRPFIYRKYIDYTALDSLRDLKRQIKAKVLQEGMTENLKLGPGGIREIEFIVQVFQLIHGGRMPELQGKALLPMLAQVGQAGFLTASEVKALKDAYVFLRRAENRVQEWNDQQAHSLPEEEAALQAIAFSMQFVTVDDFLSALNQHRQFVQAQFDQVFAEDEETECVNRFEQAWQVDLSEIETHSDIQFSDKEEIHRLLKQFQNSPKVNKMPAEARARLDKVMPLLLSHIELLDGGQSLALERVLQVFESVVRRSVYFVLLIENPTVLENLVQVCRLSQWMAQMLSKFPALLDQLVDEDNAINPLEKDALMAEAMALQTQHQGDESYMNNLRQWRHIQVFKVATADITGHLPIMQVSDYLTWIAEAVMASVLQYAWLFMNQRHGLPGGFSQSAAEKVAEEMPFFVLGYGKMGGIELGYGSDLDVVFLYDGVESSVFSQGERALENSVYFLRMGQKIISLLTTMMPTGTLYEVDARLRPNGNSGMLVTSLENFKQYIQNKAWVWEHQALVRARAVSGGRKACQAFDEFKAEFLQRVRASEVIKQEVLEMRQKMREGLDKTNAQYFDLKQGVGGIVDIEFMVQYFVLSFAHQYPDLTAYTDNIRLLEEIKESGLLPIETVENLEEIYQAYRAKYHRLALQDIKSMIEITEFEKERKRVVATWQKVML